MSRLTRRPSIKANYKFVLPLFRFSRCFCHHYFIFKILYTSTIVKVSICACQMNNSKPATLNSMESQRNKTERQRTASVPVQSDRTLLSWIDMSTPSLMDRILCPSEETSVPLHTRISIVSLRVAEEEELLNCQPPRTCLSPWNVSPNSQPKPERRLSSPTLRRSIPLIERLSSADPLQIPLLDRVAGRHNLTSGEMTNLETRSYLPSKRKTSQTELSAISPNDQLFKRVRKTEIVPDPNGNVWDSQTCHGMGRQEEADSLIIPSVAHAHATSSNYMARTSRRANSLYAQPPIPPKVYRPPNGSGYSGESRLTSTISSLQSSALRSMKIGRRTLEKHILLSVQAKQREKSETQLIGPQPGDVPQRPSSSLSLIDGKNWTNTRNTHRSSSTHSNPTPTKESSPMTLLSETLWEEDKLHCLPTEKSSPTYIQPSTSQTELNSRLPIPPTPHVEPFLSERQKESRPATNTTPTRAALTARVSTNTSARNAEGIIPKTSMTHRSNEEGLQPKYRRYNLWGADNQKPMTTAEWSKTAIPLPRPPKSELENTIANATIASHAHLFAVKTPINIEVFQALLSHHPNPLFVDSILAGLREGFWPWANTLSPLFPLSHTQDPNGRYDETHLSFFRDQLRHEQECSRYSPSLGTSLFPGMYSMPIYAIPKPGSTNLRLVNNHSAEPYALNSMIDHSLVTGYPLDNLHQLGDMLLNLHTLTPGLDLVMCSVAKVQFSSVL